MLKIFVTSLVGLIAAGMSTQVRADVFEGFETKQNWQIADWGDAAQAELRGDAVSEGQKSLQVSWVKAGLRKAKGIVIEQNLAIHNIKIEQVQLDVFLGASITGQLALAVETDEYYESKPIPLRSGWNRDLSFAFSQAQWKTKSSQWLYQIKVRQEILAKKLYVIFYPIEAIDGTLTIDSVRLKEPKGPQTKNQSLQALTPSRKKSNHYRPRELPIELFIRP
jgi:hypothetical protein